MNNLMELVQDPDDTVWTKSELPSVELGGAALQCATWIQEERCDGGVLFGQWLCEPGVFDVKDHPHLEYCRVLAGELKATEMDGAEHLLTAGMSFIIPKGYCARWEILSTFRKEVVVVKFP